jgi:hypothetical protein
VPQLNYNAAKDLFTSPGAEAFTFALPNKIIFLEKETLAQLLALNEQREGKDLHDLLVLIFQNFGLESDGHSLHFLRAYHLVDVLNQTTQEDVETTLLNSAEFSTSEKKKGIFYYQAPRKVVEEVKPEIPVEAAEAPGRETPEEAAPEEAISEEEIEREEAPPPAPIQVAPPVQKVKVEEPPAKEKPARKKKPKAEGERGPRPRKSERRVIEERIELAEGEQEALAAVKEKEEAEVETAAGERKEELKPAAAKEITFGGLFAEKLKTALNKKKKGTPEDQDK